MTLPLDKIGETCRRCYVPELSVLGSAARGDPGPDTNLDVLVEFEPEVPIGLFESVGIEEELTAVLGHKVGLVSTSGRKPRLCPDVQTYPGVEDAFVAKSDDRTPPSTLDREGRRRTCPVRPVPGHGYGGGQVRRCGHERGPAGPLHRHAGGDQDREHAGRSGRWHGVSDLPGECQFKVTFPPGDPDGDLEVELEIGGVKVLSNISVTVQR